MTEPLADACASCVRARVVGWLCWPCHHHLADLLSDRPGSDWNPARPDDPYVPPGLGWLIPALHRHTGQRSTKAEQEGGSAAGFASRSPADDHILALRDHRTQIVDEFAVLAGGRWMGYSARQLAETDPETIMTARTELRATQRHLLAVLGDGFGARLVGYCRITITDAFESLPCGAPLWCPPQPPHGDDEAGLPPSVRCPACRHVYGGLSLVQMGRVMPEEVAA